MLFYWFENFEAIKHAQYFVEGYPKEELVAHNLRRLWHHHIQTNKIITYFNMEIFITTQLNKQHVIECYTN